MSQSSADSDNGQYKQRILLVASKQSEVTRFSTLLSGERYPVKHCTDMASALGLLKTGTFALVIINVDACGQSGLDIAAALKQQRPNLKSVVLSGYAHRAVINNAKHQGAIDVVALKTINDNDFLALISTLFLIEPTSTKGQAGVLKSPASKHILVHPDNSLLYDLERKYPGIFQGSWSEEDNFLRK